MTHELILSVISTLPIGRKGGWDNIASAFPNHLRVYLRFALQSHDLRDHAPNSFHNHNLKYNAPDSYNSALSAIPTALSSA